MVAYSRQIEILSRPRIPFVNGEPVGRDMDICPYRDASSSGKPCGPSEAPAGHPFAWQDRNNRAAHDRETCNGRGVLREPDINKQTWLAEQIGWPGKGRLGRPRWVSGGI